MPDEFKIWVSHKVFNIGLGPSEEVIYGDDFIASFDQSVAKM